MRPIAAKAIAITIISAVLFLLLLVLIIIHVENGADHGDRSAYYKVYADLFQTIVVGFVVALLGIFVPALIGELKYGFDRLQHSRTLYSEAKTGVDYLPLRLCSMDFQEAAALIQQVHVYKHQAELYAELQKHLEKHEVTPNQWSEIMYRKLSGFRNLLQEYADEWETLGKAKKLELLTDRLNSVKADLKKEKYPGY